MNKADNMLFFSLKKKTILLYTYNKSVKSIDIISNLLNLNLNFCTRVKRMQSFSWESKFFIELSNKGEEDAVVE